MSAISQYVEQMDPRHRLARLQTIRKALGGYSAGEMLAPKQRKDRAPGALAVACGMAGTKQPRKAANPDAPRMIEARRKAEAVLAARGAGLNRRQIIETTGISKSQVDRIIAASK
jgi:hypothetical protein